MKSLYLPAALFLATTAILYGANQYSPMQEAAQNRTPENTRITFDIDDVILKFPKGAIRNFFWSNWWLVIKNVSLAGEIKKMINRHAGGLEYVDFFKEHKCPQLADAIEKLLHSKEVAPGMHELIAELHEAGYPLDVASNMGRRDYEFYSQKKYPETFRHFKFAKVVDYGPHRRPSRKPETEYFEEYHKESGNTARFKVYIDDRKSNVEAGRRAGFDAIHFQDANQLREDLIKRGLPLAQKARRRHKHQCAIL